MIGKIKNNAPGKNDANKELWLDYVKMGFLKNDFFEEKLMKEIRDTFEKKVGKIKKDMGPTITEQCGIVDGWWRQMVISFKPEVHESAVKDLPISVVTQFLI